MRNNLQFTIYNLQKKIRFNSLELIVPASQAGQALITLLFFVVVSIVITSAAIIIIVINSTSMTKIETGVLAKSVAESGAENAILRLLRNPSYSGENLTIGDGTAIIEVEGIDPIIIESKGQVGNSIKIIQVEMGYSTGVLSLESWKEIQ